MLKKIGLKNVRSFKDLKDLEIKPITVLCGTNSSGKSTILKSLLLWKQTLENFPYIDGFLLNGKYTNLGTQENLLHNRHSSQDQKLHIGFQKLSGDKTGLLAYSQHQYFGDLGPVVNGLSR